MKNLSGPLNVFFLCQQTSCQALSVEGTRETPQEAKGLPRLFSFLSCSCTWAAPLASGSCTRAASLAPPGQFCSRVPRQSPWAAFPALCRCRVLASSRRWSSSKFHRCRVQGLPCHPATNSHELSSRGVWISSSRVFLILLFLCVTSY